MHFTMKKSFWIIALFSFQLIWSQTKIASATLELKKGSEYQKLMQIHHSKTDELFVSVSDKEKITLFKFNRALFLVDSLQAPKQKSYSNQLGHSFLENGETVLYFSSDDSKKIMAFTFNFNNQKTTAHLFSIPFKDELLITQFSTNNRFYMLSHNRYEKHLKCYVFEGNSYQDILLNLSDYKSNLTKNNMIPVVDYIENSSVEVIDNTIFNPLYSGAYKVKLYPQNDKVVLTLDSSSVLTQVLEIDLNSFEISEKAFPQPELGDVIGNSNSFLFQDKLFQINANAEQLVLTIQDYAQQESPIHYRFNSTENADFKNSPFLLQTGNKPVKELKNSKKFLSRLQNKSAGITVYKSENDFLLTIGGTNMVLSTESLVFGSLFSVGSVLASGEVYIPELYGDQIPQNLFFECRLDATFKPKKLSFSPLATDYVSYFLEEHSSISVYHLIKYHDFYLMSYYDAKEKQLQLRKFEDGYPEKF